MCALLLKARGADRELGSENSTMLASALDLLSPLGEDSESSQRAKSTDSLYGQLCAFVSALGVRVPLSRRVGVGSSGGALPGGALPGGTVPGVSRHGTHNAVQLGERAARLIASRRRAGEWLSPIEAISKIERGEE